MTDTRPRIEFDVQVPVNNEGLRSNVRDTLATPRDDYTLLFTPRHRPINIVANGPSASIPAGPSAAINGAIHLWEREGTQPTYWIACDPQPLVADFVCPANARCLNLVASKCHPAVFARLAAIDAPVVVWHVDDEGTRDLLADKRRVGCCVSVTLCAFELLAILGYREFDVWGWDGCYIDGKHHAIPQAHRRGEDKTIEVGNERFSSTASWALELQDALANLQGFPFPINVHGPGMFAAALSMFLPHRVRRD